MYDCYATVTTCGCVLWMAPPHYRIDFLCLHVARAWMNDRQTRVVFFFIYFDNNV